MSNSLERRIVGEVLDELVHRQGFDSWWENVGGLRSEIRRKLESRVRNILKRNATNAPPESHPTRNAAAR